MGVFQFHWVGDMSRILRTSVWSMRDIVNINQTYFYLSRERYRKQMFKKGPGDKNGYCGGKNAKPQKSILGSLFFYRSLR